MYEHKLLLCQSNEKLCDVLGTTFRRLYHGSRRGGAGCWLTDN